MSEPTVTITKRQAAALANWAYFGHYIAYDFWDPNLPLCRQLAPFDHALDRQRDIAPLDFSPDEIAGIEIREDEE